MINRLILLVLALALGDGVRAETARVRGGEHADFTRIVIESPHLGHWRFGRSPEGYAFRAEAAITGFDLSQAFDKIPKTRVAALWRDPQNGDLHLRVPCTCHAIAFEPAPGRVAIDFRAGEAPAGSSFELALDHLPPSGATSGKPALPFAPGQGPGLPPVYNWLAILREMRESPPPPTMEMPAALPAAALDPMRDALLRQISRGIADGVIEIETRHPLPEPAPATLVSTGIMRIAEGEMPGLSTHTPSTPGPALTEDGTLCPSDAALDLAAWYPAEPVAAAIPAMREGLVGEFDTPVKERILAATRLQLALGFGAEARQTLNLLPDPQGTDVAALLSLSWLVDLEAPQVNAFAGTESCDTAAALWAATAHGIKEASGAPQDEAAFLRLNNAAVPRSFSALPAAMRRHIGPLLVSYYLAHDEVATAWRLRDAALRAGFEVGQYAPGALMDGNLQLASGEAAQAAEIAAKILQNPGANAAGAMILLVDSAFAGEGVTPPDLAGRIAAMRNAANPAPMAAALLRAEILAAAMAGDFRHAFALQESHPEFSAELWLLAARSADDDLFLVEALAELTRGTPADIAPEVRFAVARRLVDHGFGAEARHWLGKVTAADTLETRLLAAEASLLLRDARAVIGLLAASLDPEADRLRARAALQLGDAAGAAVILDRSGDYEGAERARRLAGDRSRLSVDSALAWSAASALSVPQPLTVAEGPLARSKKLAEGSEAARQAINDLRALVRGHEP